MTQKQIETHKQETGRSMTEMLGVLAVIGILSIGGIIGYRNAMDKSKANDIIDGVSKRAMVLSQKAMLGQTISTDSLNADFESSINGAYSVTVVSSTGYENEYGIQVSNIPADVCDKIIDMNWSVSTGISGDTECDNGTSNTLTFAFAEDADNTKERKASPKECSGDRPACQKCDTSTGNYIADVSKDETQDKCLEDQVCDSGACVSLCTEEGDDCSSNEDCCSGFCEMTSAQDGSCALLTNGTASGSYRFAGASVTMNWWTAKNWCEAHGMSLPNGKTMSDLAFEFNFSNFFIKNAYAAGGDWDWCGDTKMGQAMGTFCASISGYSVWTDLIANGKAQTNSMDGYETPRPLSEKERVLCVN